MRRRMISWILAFVIVSSIMGTTVFAEVSDYKSTLPAIEEYVMEQVRVFAVIDNAWDETTQIKDYTVLYAPDDKINGYIFRFEKDGTDTGFMQIGIQDENMYVVNLGFEGNDILSKMVEYHNSLIRGCLQISPAAQPIINLSNVTKVYYVGGFNYYIYKDAHELVSMAENKVVENNLDNLKTLYSVYQRARLASLAESKSGDFEAEKTRDVIENYTVTGYGDAATYMKTTSYYSGYYNHCTPTAATNMVMYWKHGRGFFANHDASLSQTNVFTWFYQAMQTSQYSGTDWDNIWPAYADYFTNYSGASFAVSDRVTWVTFNKIYTKINNDIPVHLEVINYANSGNHSVNVWGYAVINSDQYLRITDNWGSTISNILIGYSDYSYGQYVYYGLSY